MTQPSPRLTAAGISRHLLDAYVDAEQPLAKVVGVDFRDEQGAPTVDSWPPEFVVRFRVEGSVVKNYWWRLDYGCDGIETHSEDEIAQVIATNVGVLIREMIVTGEMEDQSGRVYTGRVSRWHEDDGWGVIDSGELDGPVWAHFSHIDPGDRCVSPGGLRSLHAGDSVTFTAERAEQDGCHWRATWVTTST